MSWAPALQWTLTGLFGVCAGLYLQQVRTAHVWQPKVAWSLHALMAVAMIAMAWPWGMRVPPIAYVLLFTASALYFAYLGMFTAHVGHTRYHASMMASMVLMALAMPVSAMPERPSMADMGAMAGMDMADMGSPMPGMGMADMGVPPTPTWVMLTCGVTAAFFVGAALWLFFVLIRGPSRPYADLLMAAGLGVSFAALVI
jgi:uncharacterized protein DUF5134